MSGPLLGLLVAPLALLLAGCASSDGTVAGVLHKSYRLKNTSAVTVAQTLAAEERGTSDRPLVIVADERTNSVVVRGTPEDQARLEKRIRELDVR